MNINKRHKNKNVNLIIKSLFISKVESEEFLSLLQVYKIIFK